MGQLPARLPITETRPSELALPVRSMSAYVGSIVEIPFEGSGWIYLGEQSGAKGLVYDSRRNSDSGQVVVFRANAPGDYLLKFYKQDFLSDNIINDLVKLTVLSPPLIDTVAQSANAQGTTSQRTAAQSPPLQITAPQEGITQKTETAPDTAATANTAADANTAANAVATATVAAPVNPNDFLAQARTAVQAGQFSPALGFLNQYRQHYPSGSDEAWWLYGQCYEAGGATRDIRAALDAYRRITKDFPQSSRRQAAQNRIAYLERFYVNIR